VNLDLKNKIPLNYADLLKRVGYYLLEAISCSQIPVVPRFFPDKPKMAI
jgi:hypothetical protein